jgi:uncharacterized membrane protein
MIQQLKTYSPFTSSSSVERFDLESQLPNNTTNNTTNKTTPTVSPILGTKHSKKHLDGYTQGFEAIEYLNELREQNTNEYRLHGFIVWLLPAVLMFLVFGMFDLCLVSFINSIYCNICCSCSFGRG